MKMCWKMVVTEVRTSEISTVVRLLAMKAETRILPVNRRLHTLLV
jgi:hypothetical protein